MKEKRKLRAGENFFGWLLTLFSLFVLWQAYRISGFKSVSSPGTFPMAAGAVMLTAMVLVLLDNRRQEKPEAAGLADELRQAARQVLPPVFLVYVGIIVGYMLLIQPIHFLPSSFAFLLGSMIYLKGSSVRKSILIAVVMLGAIYFIFQYFFRVVLP